MSDKFPQDKTEVFPRAELRGQLLIEAMVAIGITIVGLIGVFSLLSQTFSLNKMASDQYIATNLASEGIEIVKNIIDSNVIKKDPWNKDLAVSNPFQFEIQYDSTKPIDSPTNKPLNFNSATGVYSYDAGGSTTTFRRVIVIETKMGGNELQVNSIVTWKGRNAANFSVNLEDHFFNWR